MNNIFIPFHQNGFEIGGPSSFMRNLKFELDSFNYKYLNTIWNAKIIFFPISIALEKIFWIKIFNGRVIQRLDGIYYPQRHGTEYINFNNPIKEIYQKYADFIIFQSEYSKKQCFYMFGDILENKYCIIYNGADTSKFYPASEIPSIDIYKFITTGNFRHPEMLTKIIEALDFIFMKKKYNFILYIVGKVHNNQFNYIKSRPYIIYKGEKDLYEIPALLRDSHAFIHVFENSNCPNSVIEAISCGLPIVSFDTGSIKELCFFNKELIAPTNSKDLMLKYSDFNSQLLSQKIELFINNSEYFLNISKQYTKYYDMKNCCKSYIKVFENQFKIVNKKFKYNYALKFLYQYFFRNS